MPYLLSFKNLLSRLTGYQRQSKPVASSATTDPEVDAYLETLPEVDPEEDEKGWNTLIDFTELTPDGGGIPAEELVKLLQVEIERRRK